MKIIFFGTPSYVVPIADQLNKVFRTRDEKGVVAVVTQPPKPSGRDKKIERSEVDHWAYKHNIPILFNFDNLPQADIGVVAAYGRIIPKSAINHFSSGLLNLHPSLLPKYRGASPVQAAIANGDTQTGLTVIKMDEQMDHGPIVSSFKEEIKNDDTTQSLRDRLFERSGEFLINLIPNYLNGKIKPKEQNHNGATFTKIIKKEDGFIKDLFEDPVKTERLFRAYQPWPGIYTNIKIKREIKRLKILKLHLEGKELILDTVQLEGKNPVSWEEFKRGYPEVKLG